MSATLKDLSLCQDYPTINIAILGQVSCGKSTTLNSMFVETFNETKRVRATNSINMYLERPSDHTDMEEIFITNKQQDASLKDVKVNTFVLKENVFKVREIQNFGTRKPHIYYNVIDLPGLNDGALDPIFNKWINDNLIYLDVIIFISNGEDSMNKLDERQLFTNLLDSIKSKHPDCRLIFALNKVDDEDDCEIMEVCEAAEKFVDDEIKQRQILENKRHVIRFSAENGYLLRYVFQKRTVEGMSDKNIAKLATLFCGSKWRKIILGKRTKDLAKNISIEDKQKITEYLTHYLSDKDELQEYYDSSNYQRFIDAFDVVVTNQLYDIYHSKVTKILKLDTNLHWDIIETLQQVYGFFKDRFKKVDVSIKNIIINKLDHIICSKSRAISTFNLDDILEHLDHMVKHQKFVRLVHDKKKDVLTEMESNTIKEINERLRQIDDINIYYKIWDLPREHFAIYACIEIIALHIPKCQDLDILLFVLDRMIEYKDDFEGAEDYDLVIKNIILNTFRVYDSSCTHDEKIAWDITIQKYILNHHQNIQSNALLYNLMILNGHFTPRYHHTVDLILKVTEDEVKEPLILTKLLEYVLL